MWYFVILSLIILVGIMGSIAFLHLDSPVKSDESPDVDDYEITEINS